MVFTLERMEEFAVKPCLSPLALAGEIGDLEWLRRACPRCVRDGGMLNRKRRPDSNRNSVAAAGKPRLAMDYLKGSIGGKLVVGEVVTWDQGGDGRKDMARESPRAPEL